MDIKTFLTQTAGNWFSQRTTYNIAHDEVDNSKANLTINLLPTVDNALSSQYHLNRDLALGSIKSHWDNTPDFGKPKQQGETTMLIFRDEETDNHGKILRDGLVGKYTLAEDESLTFIIEKDNQYIEERIWFASENLRLRNTILKQNGQVIQTSFYSEIRRIVTN